MSGNITDWVASKLADNEKLEIVGFTPEYYLNVRSKDGNPFVVAVTGVKQVIELSDVDPLFASDTKPHMVINIPSKALWRGAAIDRIHAASAAFGTLGDVSRAAYLEDAGSYRDKNMGFFINAMKQHKNVSSVSYIFNTVFNVDRKSGSRIVVAVIYAYNMSAEDVRDTRSHVGHFDVIVKSTSYGSITSQAEEAAMSMGAQALTFGGLMQRLAK
jgi:hypothetical protein